MGFFGEVNAIASLGEKGFKLWDLFGKNDKLCDDYYDEYNKKVFIKKNGDGLIVSSCILKVIDPIKTASLIRTLDIGDAKKSSSFVPFEKMRTTPLDNAFVDYGFWYKSDNDIITDVEEFYEEEDIRRRNDDKFISIRMLLDEMERKESNPNTMM